MLEELQQLGGYRLSLVESGRLELMGLKELGCVVGYHSWKVVMVWGCSFHEREGCEIHVMVYGKEYSHANLHFMK